VLTVSRLAYVATYKDGSSTLVHNLSSNGLATGLVQINNRDRRALAGEQRRRRSPNARGTTGNEDYFVSKAHGVSP
jgi:hypothetical protein